MSAETMRLLVKALNEEIEASVLKPVKSDERPFRIGEWCRREVAREEFGIPPHRLKKLVQDKKVKAKKFDPGDPTSVVVFKTADIRKALEAMPDYLYEHEPQTQEGDGR